MVMGRSRSKTRRHPRSNPRGVISITADGFGFVTTAEGVFFIPASKTASAFDGDLVEIAPSSVNQNHAQTSKAHNHIGEKPTARVVRIVMRAHDTLIGRYEIADPFGVVIPEDIHIKHDIFTQRSDNPSICDGDLVRVHITAFPTRSSAATGVIEGVIGHQGDENLDIETLIAHHHLDTDFSDAAEQEARRIQSEDEDYSALVQSGYRDIRDRFVCTIDPIDARDFDDALSLDPIDDDKWRLGIHIADVSAYVPWNGAIDIDARKRSTSVYLADRVIPMLPFPISSDKASLMPDQTRRTLTVDVIFDQDFRILSYDIYPSLICSNVRLSYEQVQVCLDGSRDHLPQSSIVQAMNNEATPAGASSPTKNVWSSLIERLPHLSRFASTLHRRRQEAGSIDFDTVEAKVVLDGDGHPVDVRIRQRTQATSCVEEAMILANECVARRLRDTDSAGVFRVHDAPIIDNLKDTLAVLTEFDSMKGIDQDAFVCGDPHALQDVLRRAQGRTEAPLVSSLLLRSMQRAVYAPDCRPHYGLASEAYCHFTSPIRRYPDLVVHRMLKALIFHPSDTYTQQCDATPSIAEHASAMERIADEAARESQELKLVEYMRQSVGLSFRGMISGVTTYGVYVRLDNTVEGLIPVRALGEDYFALDVARHLLRGQSSGRIYRLGQPLDVAIVAAPEHARRLDMRLAGKVAS
jgi:ribonuclease R